MFGSPLDRLEFSDILSFLQTGVREGFTLDFKVDFPSSLEKTLAAFANTYGGVALIGVDETPSGAAVIPVKGVQLKSGLRERVLQKALEAVYPPLLPEVQVVEFKSNDSLPNADRAIVVIRVIESDASPHAVEDRSIVYLRNDNISTRFLRKASVGEIEWLSNKRRMSIEMKERLIQEARERAENIRSRRRNSKCQERYWRDGCMSLICTPTFPRSPLLDSRAWTELVQQSRTPINTIVDEIPTGRLQRIPGGVLFDGEYGSSQFLDCGLIVHEFDYWWDYLSLQTSQTVRRISPMVTAALVAGVFENTKKLYAKADYFGLVDFEFSLSGVKDAQLLEYSRALVDIPQLLESEVIIKRRFSVGELEDQSVPIAISCQQELYWAFGFDAPEKWLKQDFHLLDTASVRSK
jgi:hypothetical protein